MKYTTASIIASLAASAVATSSGYCPKDVAETITVTETCAEKTVEVWQTTVTVPAPEVKTITVGQDGKEKKQQWEAWTPASSSEPLPQATGLPAGCSPATHTLTHTESVKKPGSVTTKTGSTLFVGVGQAAKTTVTVTEGGAVTATGSSGPAITHAPFVAPEDLPKAKGDDTDDDDDNDLGISLSLGPGGVGVGVGNWGITVSEKLVATGTQAFQWTLTPTGVTEYITAVPTYTKKPDGKYGFNWGDWGNWPNKGNGGGSGGSGTAPGSGGKFNSTLPGSGGKLNSTLPGSGGKLNSTLPGTGGQNNTLPVEEPTDDIPEPGSAGSNVTKPFEFLQDTKCNDASNRGKWCDGRSISTDVYQKYSTGKICAQEFTLTSGTADFDGTEVPSLLINGQSPGPAIECNWGDTIQVTVHNKLPNNGTTIHWHGIRMVGENDQDGVPGVTECPLAPGASRTYSYLASSYGTGWYHSHWMAQSGDGIRGPMIIHGPATGNYDIDAGVVEVSDTFPGDATATQWNWVNARSGPQGTKNYLLNGHNTQADLSAGQHALWVVEPGKSYRFRFINSASQNMYSVSLDGHKMKVIAADFTPIVPYETTWLNIGIGQRYDVIVEMNQKVESYFLRAVTQTGCPSQCDNTGLGQANGIIAYKGVPSKPYLLPTTTANGNKKLADFTICDDEPLASLVPYVRRTAGSNSAFKSSVEKIPAGQVSNVDTTDDGVITRWFINNGWQNINFTDPTLQQLNNNLNLAPGATATKIDNSIVLKKKNSWYYFIIQNQFIAGHPMHLHGHDFSILGQGSGVFDDSMVGTLNFDNPMRRDTGMLKGIETLDNSKAPETGYTVIGFESDNPGAWLMHCHIIWHVDGGLSLQWIERPDDITTSKYVTSEFKDQCAAYSKYELLNPGSKKTSSQSGLKRSLFFDEQISVIERRSAAEHEATIAKKSAGSAQAKYLAERKAKRGIGHNNHNRA